MFSSFSQHSKSVFFSQHRTPCLFLFFPSFAPDDWQACCLSIVGPKPSNDWCRPGGDRQLWGCRSLTLSKPYSALTADCSLLLCLQAEDLAVIELDIGQAPTFKHELPPQARRHTLWSTCDDFTAGAMTATRSATESFTKLRLSTRMQSFSAPRACQALVTCLSAQPWLPSAGL